MRSAWACANTLLIVVAEGGLLGVLQTPTRTSVPRATMPEGHEHHAGPLTVMPDGLEYLAGPVTCKSASVHLERHPDLPLPRMVITASDPPLSDETIDTVIEFLDEVLMEEIDVPFSICWDVRSGAFPSMKQFKRVQQYLGQDGRTEVWDSRVQGNAAVIRNRLLRGTARLMASIARPPQPSSSAPA